MRTSKPARSPNFVLWTDGSARDRDLGWGAVLWRKDGSDAEAIWDGERLAFEPSHGSEVAEWRAAAEGLALIRAKKQPVLLLSDSQSVVDFLNGVAGGNAVGLDLCLARVGSRAFFQLGREAAMFDFLQALKVKGHAGSAGNLLVDELATRGRVSLAKGREPAKFALLAKEVETLLRSGSTSYASIAKPSVPPRGPKPSASQSQHSSSTPTPRLSPAQIQDLTRGMNFELTLLEQSKIAARSRELLEKALALPDGKPAQKKKRALAVRHAEAYPKTTRKNVLAAHRKEAALQLFVAQHGATD